MAGFNKFGSDRGGDRGGRSFGGGGFGGPRKFGGNSGAPRQMHHATCSKCGNDCEVPFRPTGERPVFCSNCFKTEGDRAPRSDSGPRFSAPRSFGGGNTGGNAGGITKEQFDMLNSKLDKVLAALAPAKSHKVDAAMNDDFYKKEVKVVAVEKKEEKEVEKKAKAPVKKAKAKKK